MRALALSEWLLIELAKPSERPLNRRIYAAIRHAIRDDVLPRGARLPSSRDLARDLNVSRNTVVAAIDELLAEGYLEARVGSGTYVVEDLPDDRPRENPRESRLGSAARQRAAPPQPVLTPGAEAPQRSLSARGRSLTDVDSTNHFEVQPFAPGLPDYASLPFKHWGRLLNRYLTNPEPDLLDCGEPGGHMPLRVAVARYLTVSRSVLVEPEQILITSSTQQSIDLCAHLLADHGDLAWIEDPGYWGARRALQAAGMALRPVSVDGEGLAPQAADWDSSPRLIYVTPSNQYPTGAVMSLERRKRLLDFAASRNAWIIEDDYDSEFRYEGRPLPALQGMDNQGRVIYLGTFSKVLYQGIRLGYMAVPADLVEQFKAGLYDLHRPGQLMLQAALADFMDEGLFEAHIRRTRIVYGERRAQLRAILERALGQSVRLSHGNAGMNMVINLPPGCDDVALTQALARVGLTVRPLSRYFLGPCTQSGLVVGFGYVDSANIEHYGPLLARVIAQAVSGARDNFKPAQTPGSLLAGASA